MIHHGDCLDVMAGMEPESIDAIVTDPPYDLGEPRSGSDWKSGQMFAPRSEETKARRRGGFMGKAWDGTGIAFRRETWEQAFRVAKPGAYLLAFGGTRTVHRMTCAIEDAGWIIRDMLVWGYASGFPKGRANLKPAWEPIVMARKPGPLRMLNIDGCRIAAEPIAPFGSPARSSGGILNGTGEPREQFEQNPAGRWPANVILTDPIFDGGWEGVVGGGEAASGIAVTRNGGGRGIFSGIGDGKLLGEAVPDSGYGDSGTYSRFFLVPKASRSDREPVLGGLPERELVTHGAREQGPLPQQTPQGPIRRANVHPTVKPLELMRHLVRLVAPPDGTVLDPFLGSGTTGLAAEQEGFAWVGIEKEAEYVEIAEARLNGTQRGLGLPG